MPMPVARLFTTFLCSTIKVACDGKTVYSRQMVCPLLRTLHSAAGVKMQGPDACLSVGSRAPHGKSGWLARVSGSARSALGRSVIHRSKRDRVWDGAFTFNASSGAGRAAHGRSASSRLQSASSLRLRPMGALCGMSPEPTTARAIGRSAPLSASRSPGGRPA